MTGIAMLKRSFLAAAAGLLLLAQPLAALAAPIAIVGATLVGTDGAADRPDMVVVIDAGRIAAVGRRGRVRPPPAARIVDARGRYLMPGLIDAFGAMRSQAYADAYLYAGVTTVVVPRAPAGSVLDGEQVLARPASGPAVLTGRAVSGYSPSGDLRTDSPWIKDRSARPRLGLEALRRQVDEAAAAGDRVIDAGPDLWPDQLRAVTAAAHRRGLAVFAEPAFATYAEAAQAGVDAFVRNDRYALWTAGPERFAAFAADPFGAGARAAITAVCAEDDKSPGVVAFGRALRGGPALIPALSMEATADDVGGPNPWTLPSAIFLRPSDLDDPVDPATGARPYLKDKGERAERVRACARSKQAIDRGLHANGARHVAGTSAPGYGVMPGGGLHVELQLLQAVGLSGREALAAATSGAADALRLKDRGRIAPGLRADLVLLRGDPVRDLSALDDIETVFVAGRPVDPRALAAAARGRNPPSAASPPA